MAEEVWYSGREALKKTNEDSYLDVMNAQHAALSTAAKEYRQHCEMEKQVGISKHPLLADTELILAGFGSGRPHLIVVSEFHKPRLPKKEHFAVIGNATGMVEAILTDFFEFNPNASLAEIIYKVCAVKFAAEAHRAIGKGKTCVTIHNSNGEWWYLPFERVDKLRTLCRQVPTGIEELLGSQPVAVVDDEEGELYCATDPDFNANFVRPKA